MTVIQKHIHGWDGILIHQGSNQGALSIPRAQWESLSVCNRYPATYSKILIDSPPFNHFGVIGYVVRQVRQAEDQHVFPIVVPIGLQLHIYTSSDLIYC